MKLRLQSNSVRFRLKQKEVRCLAEAGRVEEVIRIGGELDAFTYVLEATTGIDQPDATLLKTSILVRVPQDAALAWANGPDVGIEARQKLNDGELHIIVEKDFACLNGAPEQNVDTFPNPLEGTKC